MFREFQKHWETNIQDLNKKFYDSRQCSVIYHGFESHKLSILMYEQLNMVELLELESLETSLFIALESAYSNYRVKESFLSRFFGIFSNIKNINIFKI
ncbi:MAG: hypothetical protein Q8R04_04515 [Nanoarchaeota archaeon]|nr:hypothetical protein [Nanoarchaeota archaeon]